MMSISNFAWQKLYLRVLSSVEVTMKVNTSYNSQISNYTAPSFKAAPRYIINGYETSLTPKAINLIKKMNCFIDDAWTDIKKGKSVMDFPKFTILDAKERLITLKPVYQGLNNLLLLEVNSNKSVDRVFINRVKPRDFRYERAILTDHGSATVKSFNALTERNVEIEEKVNEYIEKYFPKILPSKEQNLTKKALGLD